MKAICVSDLHVHNYKQFDKEDSRLEMTLQAMDEVFLLALKEKAGVILFAGDLYDQQKSLPTVVVNGVIDRFIYYKEAYPGIKVIAITGNHDQATKNLIDKPAVTALKHLTSVNRNFILADNTYIIADNAVYVYGIPYYEYPEMYRQALVQQVTAAKSHKKCYSNLKQILLIHQTPKGLPNELIPFDADPEDELYKSFDMVYCGHIHTKQKFINNFMLVGSPLHRDLGDVGEEKGVWLTDLSNPKKNKFVSFADKFPNYRYYKEGEEIPDDPNIYPVILPKPVALTEKDVKTVENFNTSLSTYDLVKNYWGEVSKDPDLLKTGLSFL